jgi:hypothetical protein
MAEHGKYDTPPQKTTEEDAADRQRAQGDKARQPQTPGSPATPGSGSGDKGAGSPAGTGSL